MSKTFVSLVFFFLVIPSSYSQVHITGKAAPYVGQEITISSYNDLFTFETVGIEKDTVDSSGNFGFNISLSETGLYVLGIGNNVFAHIFLERDGSYELGIPAPEKLHPALAQDIFVQPAIEESPGTLNTNIEKLESDINTFLVRHALEFETGVIKTLADSAILEWKNTVPENANPFFREYHRFRMAEVELVTGQSRSSVFSRYFKDVKPAYGQLSYANAFKQLFAGYLRPHSIRKNSEAATMAIRTGNLAALDSALQQDSLLENKELRQLLMATELYELGITKTYTKEKILPLLQQLSKKAVNAELEELARVAAKKINHLSPGTEAPDFTFNDHLGNLQRLSQFRGAVVYLNFIRDWNLRTAEEISLMKVLKNGYGQDIAFITIYVGNEPKVLRAKMKDLKIDWMAGTPQSIPEVVSLYALRAFPAYFFIDKNGMLSLSPAPPPGARIEKAFAKEYQKAHADDNKLFKLQPPKVDQVPEK